MSLGKKLVELSAPKKVEFISKLFSARDTIHLIHLRVHGPGSYAQHVALNDLYDAVLTHADDISELIQSYEGIMNLSIQGSSYVEPLPFLTSFRMQLIQDKSLFNGQPDIQNKIDELIGDISKAIYKLTNLA